MRPRSGATYRGRRTLPQQENGFVIGGSAMKRWLAALVVCLGGAHAAAQDFRGAISGTVNDSTGGALPGAEVMVTNEGTGVAVSVATDAKGFYQARYLISGTYAVSARISGFKAVVRKGIEVRVGDVVAVDLVL